MLIVAYTTYRSWECFQVSQVGIAIIIHIMQEKGLANGYTTEGVVLTHLIYPYG